MSRKTLACCNALSLLVPQLNAMDKEHHGVKTYCGWYVDCTQCLRKKSTTFILR